MTKQEFLNEIKTRKMLRAEIMDTIEAQKRSLTNVETEKLEGYKAEIADFEAQIRSLDTQNSKKRIVKSNSSFNDEKFTLTSFLRNLKNGSFTESEKEVIARGRELFDNTSTGYVGTPMPIEFSRATLVAGTSTVGSELVPEEKFDLLMPLRAQSVLAQAGATILSGLKGNISIPTMTGTTASWKGEVVAADDGVNAFLETDFSPKKLTVYLPVSNLLLIQNSVSAEQKLQEDLVNAINEKLEATFLGTSAGSSTQPAGLFYGASYGSITGATDWSKVVALETNVKANNSNGNVYLVHPTTIGSMKTTAKAANTATFIAENSLINGYKFLTTTNMPTVSSGKGIIFGNFKDFYINFWSGMDVIVDNITGAKEGITNFIVTVYVDGGSVRSTSFAKGWLS
jgi:HK97 family phage major capsid protein